MDDVVAHTSVELIRQAVAEPTLPRALRHLGLVPTVSTVRAFLARAEGEGVDVQHLQIPSSVLQALPVAVLAPLAADCANLQQVLACLGREPGGKTYAVLRGRLAELGMVARHLEARPVNAARRYAATDAELAEAVAASATIAGVLRRLGLTVRGGNYRVVRERIAQLGLDTGHFRGQGWARGTSGAAGRSLQELLRAGTSVDGQTLIRKLVAARLREWRCEMCGGDTWLGAPIPLELDHVNGDRYDNRLENLRLLCPNCHSRTPTYRGRNIGRYREAAVTLF